MTVQSISSNLTGLAYAEEATLKTLPGSPVWYGLVPNTYAGFGAKLKTVARDTINPSRQLQKGVVTDLDATGGFNIDYTQTNLQRLMQGVFFADMREKADTASIVSAGIPITSVDATGHNYVAASGLTVFKVKHLVYASGFTNTANNGLQVVTTVTGTDVTVAGALTTEASPPAAASIEAVGVQFASDDVAISVVSTVVSLTSTVFDLTTLGLIPGEWVFLGGDTTTLRFVNNQGYARILSIATHAIIFDETTFTAASETTTSKTVQMFFGRLLRNELASNLIKRRTYNVERQLGVDADGTMSEYLIGAVADGMVFDIPQADKIKTDFSFVACDNQQFAGSVGVKAGARVADLAENAYNTSSDVYQIKLSINSTSSDPTPLFGYVTAVKLDIKNNVKPVKAVGVLGAFDTIAGNFQVTGSLTAYFTTIPAVQAVRNNANVGLNVIVAHGNAGFVLDIPLASLGNGELTVTKDAPITVPLDTNAAQNAQGYTMLANFFTYLPTLAMPVAP